MKIKKFEELNESIIVDINKSQWFELDEQQEEEYAENFSFSPVPLITVLELNMDMKDDSNGFISIKLSNGDLIEYFCEELSKLKRGSMPGDVNVHVDINGKKVIGIEFLDEYAGQSTWVKGVLDFYIDYKFKKSKKYK